MPLAKGTSKEVIFKNIEEMRKHGHSHEQSVAAALHTAHPQGGKSTDAGVSGVDGVLNWAAGNHLMSPTESYSVKGETEVIDPKQNSMPGVSGVDSFEKEAAQHLRKPVIPRR
jgi:hypothetical protein